MRVAGLTLLGCAIAMVAFSGSVSPASASSEKLAAASASDPRLEKSYRFQQGGWTYVHLEGSPSEIGFQHGYLLAPEIADALEAIRLFDTHQTRSEERRVGKEGRPRWPPYH